MKTLPILLFSIALGLAGCEKGPAESFGESIDDAARDAGNAIEDLCEDVRDGVGAADRNC